MAGQTWDRIAEFFEIGGPIEISCREEGFHGSWFPGTLIRPSKKRPTKVVVEYSTLYEDEAGTRLEKEVLELAQIRPPPPAEKALLLVGSDVDAYYKEGWWEGVIFEVVKRVGKKDKYGVYFRGTREKRFFKAQKLRRHREWVDGQWVPAVEPLVDAPADVDAPLAKKAKVMEIMEYNFSPGELVEVRSDEEGFVGSWYAATVIEPTNKGKYLIEHSNILENEKSKALLREEVDGLNLRPRPPVLETIDSFDLHDQVDAWYNEGWWVGTVYKILKNDRYSVYFRCTDDESKFEHSALRVHQEWRDGKWHIASKALNL